MSKRKIEDIERDLKEADERIRHNARCAESFQDIILDATKKKEECEQKHDKYQLEIMELEKEIEEAKKPKTIWDLEKDGEYYWVSGAGEVMRDLWFGGLFEVKRRDIRNVFLTKQEAEDEARARKLIAKARGSEGRKNFDSNSYNWEIVCIYPSDISQSRVTVVDYTVASRANVFGSWETQEAAEKVLYKNYEEFKWYFTEYLR